MLTRIQRGIKKKDSVSHIISTLLDVWNKSALELLYILVSMFHVNKVTAHKVCWKLY